MLHHMITIDDTEVKCIQESVENLVERLVAQTTESHIYKKSVDKAVRYLESEEIYSDCTLTWKFLKNYSLDKNENILSVGSFYENTRNIFPDEFDFVVVLTECLETERDDKRSIMILDGFHESLCHVVKTNAKELKNGNLQLLRVIKTSGPATKLEFVYENGVADERLIEVDLSPALRLEVTDRISNSQMESLHLNEQWYKRVLKTGHYLQMLFYKTSRSLKVIGYSIVETELKFLAEEVSFNHKLAFRFLKYILSTQNEEIRDMISRKLTGRLKMYDFSSYLVKTLLYKHVLMCQSDYSTGQCSVSMLTCLLKKFPNDPHEHCEGTLCYTESSVLRTILGSDITISDDEILVEKMKTVLGDYIEQLKQIQSSPHNQHLFTPFAGMFRPWIEQHLTDSNFS